MTTYKLLTHLQELYAGLADRLCDCARQRTTDPKSHNFNCEYREFVEDLEKEPR